MSSNEKQLQIRISKLREELQTATKALNRLHGVDESSEDLFLKEYDEGPGTPVAVAPPGKRGYLFKWQDRSIGWGGTKWALRWVVLEGGRLAYHRSHTGDDSPRYVLALRGCAVRDDGFKRNRRHVSKHGKHADPPMEEPGAYFHVFSIYQRNDNVPCPSEITPLLRFSTPSLAEQNQWMQLISEACAYAETDAFLASEEKRREEAELQRQEQLRMAVAMPEARRGTLPALYFAHAPRKLPRLPSGTRLSGPSQFRSKSASLDADKMDSRSTRGFPPSKPMHREAAPSFLSEEAPVQNYRGFFNLAVIILVLSNFRLILHTARQHGFVLHTWAQHVQNLSHFSRDPWVEFPIVTGFLLLQAFVITGFVLEKLLSLGKLNERIGMGLHHINAHGCLVTSVMIVWYHINKPTVGGFLAMHGAITWMKLISYFLANQDYRLSIQDGGLDAHQATLALIENLDEDEMDATYPRNVTLRNMYYFWFAPTLTYQIAFPKTPKVRIWRVVGLALRMAFVFALFSFLFAQIVTPSLNSLVIDMEATNGVWTFSMFAEYWLKLSIANTYLWLLLFYFYFHLYLNFVAELLRFGDRVFYKDWWNSTEVSSYWRLWNMPVHYWLIRHVYFPCVRRKLSRNLSTLIVFFVSAVLHELLISVPFHMVRPWSFLGMMGQVPLVALTKYLYRRYPGSSIGNIIFWLSFCVIGQPMAILLYTVDYQYGNHEIASVHDCPSPQEGYRATGQCVVG